MMLTNQRATTDPWLTMSQFNGVTSIDYNFTQNNTHVAIHNLSIVYNLAGQITI